MLLQPKKLKKKKVRKGNLKKISYKTSYLRFGWIGLKSIESGTLTFRNIEASRQAISRKIKKKGKLWIRIFPHTPLTNKSLGSRMGKGKGSFKNFIIKISSGTMLFELCGVNKKLALKAFKTGSAKLSVKTIVVN